MEPRGRACGERGTIEQTIGLISQDGTDACHSAIRTMTRKGNIVMFKLVALATSAFALVAPAMATDAKSKPCFAFDEKRLVTVQGLLKSIVEEGEGGLPEKIMILKLDYPMCFRDPTGDRTDTVDVFPFSRKWLGHHVVITGTMFFELWFGVKIHKIKDAQDSRLNK
jgi:hypothetical protein